MYNVHTYQGTEREWMTLSMLSNITANTKLLHNICTMLDQPRRRSDDVVQMLYKCFVFAGIVSTISLQAQDTEPMFE